MLRCFGFLALASGLPVSPLRGTSVSLLPPASCFAFKREKRFALVAVSVRKQFRISDHGTYAAPLVTILHSSAIFCQSIYAFVSSCQMGDLSLLTEPSSCLMMASKNWSSVAVDILSRIECSDVSKWWSWQDSGELCSRKLLTADRTPQLEFGTFGCVGGCLERPHFTWNRTSFAMRYIFMRTWDKDDTGNYVKPTTCSRLPSASLLLCLAHSGASHATACHRSD